jgi:hypothetical protein
MLLGPSSWKPPEDPGDALESADVYDPSSYDEQPQVDEAVSQVVRKPTRTAGDLSEGGEASGGITAEELGRRVQRIEDHLGIGDREEHKAFDYPDDPGATPPQRSGDEHPIVRPPGAGEPSEPES